MKVKKYKAENMQDAMQLVRLELGDEAVILQSKAVKTTKFFGLLTKKSVEVIAAVDEDIPRSTLKPKSNDFLRIGRKQDATINNRQNGIDEQQTQLLDNILEMKKMIRTITNIKHKDPSLPDLFNSLEEKLLLSDVGASFTEEIMEKVYTKWLEDKSNNIHSMLELVENELLNSLEDISFEEDVYQKKFVCLVGPTGVGKTTTLAKLAANASLKQKKSIGFITTDTYRIAAIEQLKTYASILEAPIEVCYSASDFKKAKENLAHLDLLFIDTAGRNFLRGDFIGELKEILDFDEEMTTYLVLALTSKLEDMKEITDQFWDVGIHRFIFTKKDETHTSSAMYSLARLYKKGTAFVTDGQNVPEDLVPFSRELMVKAVIEEIKK